MTGPPSPVPSPDDSITFDPAPSPSPAAVATRSVDGPGRGAASTIEASREGPGRGPKISTVDEITLGQEIARGPDAIVWEGLQVALERPVAVKTPRGDVGVAGAEARFTNEAMILCRLEHPSIVPIHAFGRDETGRPVLCMKLTRGIAWSSLLTPKSPQSGVRAAGVDLRTHIGTLQRVCDAIAFAHANGVVHRSVTPANVRIGDFGEVLVTGWDSAVDLARAGAAAPADATPAKDVAALGAILEQVIACAESRGTAPPASLLEIAAMARAGGFAGARELSVAIDEAIRNEASMRLASAALARLDARIALLAGEGPGPAVETYATLAECIAELERSVKSWRGNRAAAAGIVRGTLAFAGLALAQGDALIAAHQLDRLPPATPGVAELRAKVNAVEAERAAERHRRRRWAIARVVAVVAAIAGAVAGVFELRRASLAEDARMRRREAIASTEGATWKEPAARIEIFRRAIELDPSWREAYLDLVNAYIKQALIAAEADPAAGEALLRKAKDVAEGALAADPTGPPYAPALYHRGYCLQMLGEEAAALADFRRAAEAGRGTHDGVAAATVIALAEQRFEEAARLATVAIERGADEDDFWRRAVARFVRGDLDGALADLAEAEVILPAQQAYDALTALCLIARGDTTGAGARVAASARAHERQPHLGPVLALLAAWRGDLDEARLLADAARVERAAYARCFLDAPITRVLGLAPPPRAALGAAYTLSVDLAAVVPAEPRDATRRRRKAEEMLAKGGDPVGALALIERALGDDVADGLAHLAATRALLKLGHLEAARRHALLAERLSPHRAVEARALIVGAERR